ncbi:MAG: hypothetical protein U9Q80_08080 [Bacillota bacterium]|nr:hypothetical protein [Bacillota bacterium]
MSRIQDIKNLFMESWENSLQLTKKLPLLLVFPIVHFLAYYLSLHLISFINLGIFSSLLGGLIFAVILSSYFYVLFQAMYYKRFKFKYIYSGIKVFLLKSWIFLLIMNLSFYILMLLGINILLGKYIYILPFIIFILFNPMPEIIYISDYDERDMFFYNFNFIKRNFLQWYSINAVFLLGLIILFFIGSMIPYVSNIIILVYVSFVMIFRGQLFKKLHLTNYRKRVFNHFSQ